MTASERMWRAHLADTKPTRPQLAPPDDVSRGMVERLYALALRNNAEKDGAVGLKWDVAGRCQHPVERTLYARPPNETVVPVVRLPKTQTDKPTATPLSVTMHFRCRKCNRCRAYRSYIWRMRGQAEWQASVRTWQLTLTLKPELQNRALMQARVRLRNAAVEYDRLSFIEQFRELTKETNPLVTRYIKRIRRANEDARCAILVVVEYHKTGLPHYHVLLHEKDPDRPFRHADIRKSWIANGFFHGKLIEADRVWYSTKYLSKNLAARVRASRFYGET